MKKKLRFILNPRSGSGRQNLIPPILAKELDLTQFEYEVKHTEGPKHACELSKEAASLGYYGVVAIGGDGTVNEVGRGVVNTETSLGIIPMGSGNGVARSLKIPVNPVFAIRGLARSYPRIIDTGLLNGELFIGVAGIGFDAHIANLFATLKTRGLKSYIRLITREYSKYKAQEFIIKGAASNSKKIGLMMTFANTNQFGNEARIAPQAKPDDGILEVCMLKKFPLYVLPSLSLKLFTGKIDQSVFYESFSCNDIEVKQTHLTAHVDGEPLNIGTDVKVSVISNSLKVLIQQP
jgi:diacylglycerol kinase (ATP)